MLSTSLHHIYVRGPDRGEGKLGDFPHSDPVWGEYTSKRDAPAKGRDRSRSRSVSMVEMDMTGVATLL